MKPSFDPEHARAVVLSWPDRSLTFEAARWLFQLLPGGNVVSVSARDIERARNLAVRDVCLASPAEVEAFIFIDRDMRPDPAKVRPWVEAEADVVACEYRCHNTAAWSEPWGFHMGLVRVTRRVLETVKPPWFAFGRTADGARITSCECMHFARKVREAGFEVVRAGWCGHGGSD